MKEFTLTFKAEITNSFKSDDENELLIRDPNYVPAMETMLAQALGMNQVRISDMKVFMQEVRENEAVE